MFAEPDNITLLFCWFFESNMPFVRCRSKLKEYLAQVFRSPNRSFASNAKPALMLRLPSVSMKPTASLLQVGDSASSFCWLFVGPSMANTFDCLSLEGPSWCYVYLTDCTHPPLAVRERDFRLLYSCKDARTAISSIHFDWSADLKVTPLALAIQLGDLKAVQVPHCAHVVFSSVPGRLLIRIGSSWRRSSLELS